MSFRSIITAVLVLASLVGAWFSYSRHNSLIEARAKLETVRDRADAQERLNAMVQKYANQKRAEADTAEAEAAEAVLDAQRAEAKLTVARRVRDSLSLAIAAKDGWHAAYDDEKRAAVALRERGDSLAVANEALSQIVRDYGDASADILDATDESFFERLVPDIRPGAAVGIDPFTRRPGAVVGVTVSWDF